MSRCNCRVGGECPCVMLAEARADHMRTTNAMIDLDRQHAELRRLCSEWLAADDTFYDESIRGANSPYGSGTDWRAVEETKEAVRRHLEADK